VGYITKGEDCREDIEPVLSQRLGDGERSGEREGEREE